MAAAATTKPQTATSRRTTFSATSSDSTRARERMVSPPTRHATHGQWFRMAYGLWLLGTFAYFVPAATWNPVSRFDLTRAVVENRALTIDEYADNTGGPAFARGHWFTEKAPVVYFLAVPAYAAFYATQRIRGQRLEYSVL